MLFWKNNCLFFEDTEVASATVTIENGAALNRVTWTQSGLHVAAGENHQYLKQVVRGAIGAQQATGRTDGRTAPVIRETANWDSNPRWRPRQDLGVRRRGAAGPASAGRLQQVRQHAAGQLSQLTEFSI